MGSASGNIELLESAFQLEVHQQVYLILRLKVAAKTFNAVARRKDI